MATVQTQIRIDEDLKKDTTAIFATLGLDMSTAVNMFLRQVRMFKGLPFDVRIPEFKDDVIEAMKEAENITKDSNAKKYKNFSEFLAEVDAEDTDEI